MCAVKHAVELEINYCKISRCVSRDPKLTSTEMYIEILNIQVLKCISREFREDINADKTCSQ